MKIVRVETLGDIVAYKPKEIQVIGSVYDKVPEEFKEDFEVVLNTAKSMYDKEVDEAKKKGEKPKSAAIKKESITQVIIPFLNKFGIEKKAEHQRVIRTENPRIPEENEKKSVSRREPTLVDEVDLDVDMIGDIFNTYDSENLEDAGTVHVDLGEAMMDAGMDSSLFEDEDGLFENGEIDIENLLD